MPPPSALAIATSSINRLVKEEASYHKELEKQEARLQKTKESTEEDENREYTLKQELAAIEETKAVFPALNQRIKDALQKLEDQLETAQEGESVNEAQVEAAKAAVENAKKAIAESS